MKSRAEIPNVGAIDPTLTTSPVAEEMAEEAYTLRQQAIGALACMFNGREYQDGALVRSGATVLRCSKGLWIEVPDADLDL